MRKTSLYVIITAPQKQSVWLVHCLVYVPCPECFCAASPVIIDTLTVTVGTLSVSQSIHPAFDLPVAVFLALPVSICYIIKGVIVQTSLHIHTDEINVSPVESTSKSSAPESANKHNIISCLCFDSRKYCL